MTNHQIASILRDIADRLEQEKANPYRIRAYRRAAITIERLKVSVSDLADCGRLRMIPGIGKDLDQKIRELIKGDVTDPSGAGQTRSPVQVQWPYEVLGLDPNMARLLRNRFRIENLDDLEKLARSRLLRTLPGFGHHLEQSILEGLQALKKEQGHSGSGP